MGKASKALMNVSTFAGQKAVCFASSNDGGCFAIVSVLLLQRIA
jgi:hypothetical protein